VYSFFIKGQAKIKLRIIHTNYNITHIVGIELSNTLNHKRSFLIALRNLVLIIAFLALSACTKHNKDFQQGAYVWQRAWTPSVVAALQQVEASSHVDRWHVLAGEFDRDAQSFSPAQVSFSVLPRLKHPVVMVFRIDGQMRHLDENMLIDRLTQVRQQWQSHGVHVSALEIDYDCATQQLPIYEHFLRQLRNSLPKDISLNITALPDWRHSSSISSLLHQVSRYTLQVHAVSNPHQGLFDSSLAETWAQEFSHLSSTPFELALPNYGSRILSNTQGKLLAVESEMPILASAQQTQELMAQPAALTAFLRKLHTDPPAHLQGIVWFRLPVSGDRRTWSYQTWVAVMDGRYHAVPLLPELQSHTNGMLTVVLNNPNDMDVELPRLLVLNHACEVGDGANAYVFNPDKASFSRQQEGLLHGHAQRVIGWIRCATTGMKTYAEN
jgi:hypothetical protein